MLFYTYQKHGNIAAHLDDLTGAQCEGEQLSAGNRGVELCAVLQGARVVHVQRVTCINKNQCCESGSVLDPYS